MTVQNTSEASPHLMGVPVRVKNHHRVGGLQVEAEASGSCAQQEYEILGLWIVERFQQHSSVFRLRRA